MRSLFWRVTVAIPLLFGAHTAKAADSYVAAEAVPGTDGGYYSLPKLYLPLFLNRVGCKLEVKKQEPLYYPDPSARYRLKIDHSWFSTDTLAVETDPSGLLKSVNGNSADAAPAIIKKAVQVFASFYGVAPAGGVTSSVDTKSPDFDCKTSKDGDFKYLATIDPTSPEAALIANADIAGTGVTITARPVDAGTTSSATTVDCSEVVCFRARRPYIVAVEQSATGPKQGNFPAQAFRFLVMAPDPDRVLAIRLDRQLFATANVSLTFTDGMLTTYDSTKESEALALLKVPLDVANQLVALPGQILTVRMEEVAADAAYLEKQRALLQAQADLIEAQQKALATQKRKEADQAQEGAP